MSATPERHVVPPSAAVASKGTRAPAGAVERPPAPHPFAALTPGRTVHYVLRSGECRGAFVTYVFRVKGRLLAAGTDADGEPIVRQEWLRPDSGHCALQVEVHPVFDRDDVYPDQHQAGRWFRESVTFHELDPVGDGTPGTWHWDRDHDDAS